MGRIIAVASQKGGVGKTTTALNLSFSLARLGGQTLLIDADPQGGTALASNLKKRTTLGLVDIIKGSAKAEDAVMFTKDNLMAIVGIGSMTPENVALIEREAAGGGMAKLVKSLATRFAYTVIDAPAGIGGIVSATLAAADGVIIPVTPKNLSFKTLPSFLKLIQWIRNGVNPKLAVDGVLVTMFDGGSARDKAMLDEIGQIFPPEILFKTRIPLDDRFEEASLKSAPVSLLKDGGQSAKVYMDLAFEIKEREWKPGKEKTDEDIGLF